MKKTMRKGLSNEEKQYIHRILDEHMEMIVNTISRNVENPSYTADAVQSVAEKLMMNAEECAMVRNGQLTGTEFFMRYCDGKLWDGDIREDILPFVNEYFNGAYLDDYCDCCIDETEKPIYEVISGKADYEKLREKIDAAYRAFLLK